MKLKIIKVLLISAVVAVLVTTGFTSAQDEADTFRIGVVTSLTGSLTKGGYVTKRGYDLWAHYVNRAGGILIGDNRYKVDLIYRDGASNAAQCAKAAEKLVVGDKVDFVFGPYSSMCTLGASPIFEKYKMLHITGSAESDLIWKKHFDWTFQYLVPTDRGARGGIRAAAAQTPKPETAAIITADDAFSRTSADALKDETEKQGIEVILFEIFPVDQTEFASLVTKVKAVDPDIFIISGHPDHHIAAMRAAKRLDFNPKAYVIHWFSADFWRGLKDDANYVFGTTMWTPNVTYEGPVFGDSQSFVEEFEIVYGKSPPDYTEASSAATGVTMQIALQDLGLTPPLNDEDRAALKNYLEEEVTNTFFAPAEFSTGEFWHSNVGIELLVQQIQDANPVTVYPPELAVKDPIYPAPVWEQR